MKIHTLTLGNYRTNTYILENGGHCAVVDPGYEPETILTFLKQKGLTLDAILLTHGHFDHVGAVRGLVAETDCKVYLHEAEQSLTPMLTAGGLYHTDTYADGDTITVAGLPIRVLHTPGHTPGSVCLTVEDAMFSGDTLFAGTCGRTDLPGGSWVDMLKSLKQLAEIERNYTVLPGHGESTSLTLEKRFNPYMQ